MRKERDLVNSMSKEYIGAYEYQNGQYEAKADIDFSDYDTFLNFFENIVTAI